MGLIIFFITVLIYMVLDNKVVNDDIKECSKIKWTKEDAEQYYNSEYSKEPQLRNPNGNN